jgi:peptidyl-dipeptidase Dcp
MKYADNRELRKELYMAYGNRCFKGNKYDNQKIAIRIADLRLKLANLLGYPNYATMVLQERMAENPQKLINFTAINRCIYACG